MRTNKTLVVSLIIVTIVLFIGCQNVIDVDNENNIVDPTEYPATSPPRETTNENGNENESVKIFEFTQDSFPNEIVFDTEFEVYNLNEESITATLTLSEDATDYFVSFGHDFNIVRQVDDEWHYVPQPVGEFELISKSMLHGNSRHYRVVNGHFDMNYAQSNVVYYRFATGTHRIIAHVALMRQEDLYVMGAEPVWGGPVWAEFVIVDD